VAVIAGVASVVGASGLPIIFALANQLQLILVLIVLNVYIAEDVILYLVEFDFAAMDFSFLKDAMTSPTWYSSIGSPESTNNNFQLLMAKLEETPQEEKGLAVVGYESQSIIFNFYTLFKFILNTAIIHLLIIIPHRLAKRIKCKYVKPIVQKIREEIYAFFTFAVYLRVAEGSYLFLAINVLSELEHKSTKYEEVLGIFIIIGMILFTLFLPIHYLWYKNKIEVLEEGAMWAIYDGLKMNRWY
jgi:hypothetical protein